MSNIAVVPRLQNTWVITYYLNSADTSTCPGLLSNTAAPFTVRPLPPPPWDSPIMTKLPLAVPPSCRAPAPVLSPYTVLLFIFGSYNMALDTRSRAPRATHSFAASSHRARTRPPCGHDRVCSIENLLPRPSQVMGVS